MRYSGTPELLRIDDHRKELYNSTPTIIVTIKENNIQTAKIDICAQEENGCLRETRESKKGKRIRQHRATLKFTSPGLDVIGVEFCGFFLSQ